MPRPDFTVGVEEEYLTVDASTLELRPRAAAIRRAATETSSEIHAELTLAQVEIATPICASLDDVRRELLAARATVAAAAASVDSAALASGTHPFTPWLGQVITPEARYLGIEDEYQQLAREQLICGCHVHVHVGDPDTTIRVMDRVRAEVHVLLAISGNSPFWQGVDTGYASYRTVLFDRWPTAGPAPLLGDWDGYQRAIDGLVEIGAIPDATYLWWHLRPSTRYPTLELRIADVCATADDAVLVAALFRSLARAAATGRLPDLAHQPTVESMRAAAWRAGRYGLAGDLVDFVAGALVPGATAVMNLVDRLQGDLVDHGEWRVVRDLAAGVIARGTGAARQRAAAAQGGLTAAARHTVIERAAASPAAAPPAVAHAASPAIAIAT